MENGSPSWSLIAKAAMAAKIRTLLAISAAGVGLFALSPLGRDHVACRLPGRTPQLFGSLAVTVDGSNHAPMLNLLRDYARSNNMVFGLDVYPAGSAGIEHPRMVMEACSRFVSISASTPSIKMSSRCISPISVLRRARSRCEPSRRSRAYYERAFRRSRFHEAPPLCPSAAALISR